MEFRTRPRGFCLDIDPSLSHACDPLFIEAGQLVMRFTRLLAGSTVGSRALLLLPLEKIIEIVHFSSRPNIRERAGMVLSLGRAYSAPHESEI